LKRKLADFLISFAPPPLPVSPGSPEVDPMIDQNRLSREKIGLIATFIRVYPKKGEHVPGEKKNRRNQRVFFSRYLAANYGASLLGIFSPIYEVMIGWAGP